MPCDRERTPVPQPKTCLPGALWQGKSSSSLAQNLSARCRLAGKELQFFSPKLVCQVPFSRERIPVPQPKTCQPDALWQERAPVSQPKIYLPGALWQGKNSSSLAQNLSARCPLTGKELQKSKIYQSDVLWQGKNSSSLAQNLFARCPLVRKELQFLSPKSVLWLLAGSSTLPARDVLLAVLPLLLPMLSPLVRMEMPLKLLALVTGGLRLRMEPSESVLLQGRGSRDLISLSVLLWRLPEALSPSRLPLQRSEELNWAPVKGQRKSCWCCTSTASAGWWGQSAAGFGSLLGESDSKNLPEAQLFVLTQPLG